ncbi:hypothetical protein ABZ942_34905 [Nocardia sp. NPDC046473]|uniref:hypothetical protein n=1 Tax=Nocardia sp. NPDC046473 TaxID=3155733 RepID=UPI0034074695
MTSTEHRPARIAGVEPGTAVLAFATCLAFSIGIAALTQSATTTVLAFASIAAGLALVLTILPHKA